MEQIKLDNQSIIASKIEIDESENPELAAAVNALRDYALDTILSYNEEIREAFRSFDRTNFDNEVKRAINDAVTGLSRGELTSELAEKEKFSVLYAEMFTDHEFAENLYSEISDILYAEHTRRVEKTNAVPTAIRGESRGNMSNLEQNAAIANESREEINSDLAVGMVEAGLHVFIEKTDELLTYDMVFNSNEPIDFENRTFTAPMMEVAQYGALESLCEDFDSLDDDVREYTDMSLEDYADEWRYGLSEWQNIRASILSGKTNYLREFLGDISDISAEYPSRARALLEDLNHYEATYLKEKRDIVSDLKQDTSTESSQNKELESFCTDFADFAADVKADMGISLEERAVELSLDWDSDESQYGWKSSLNESENIRLSISVRETKYLHSFLNEVSPFYSKASELLKDLNHYEETYSKERENMENKQVLYSIEQGDELRYYLASNGYTADDILKMANSPTPFLKLMDIGIRRLTEAKYAEIEQSDKCAVSITINLDTGKARIYEINGGNGGIAEDDRNDNNVRFTNVKISEYAKSTVEHIPLQQDISHKTNNGAELSAAEKSANGQKRSIIMSNNTKLSVSSMTILGEDSSAKAYATVTINDEFAIRNVKVFEGKNGPFVSMPSRKIGGEYQDVVFPITKEAREQFNAAVINCYNEMQSNGQEKFMSENTPPEKAISTITASVHLNEGSSNVKATGQIVIDDSFVVSGVCVIVGNGNLFASMPSYTNDIDERKDFAFPITKECYEKVQGAVLNDFNYIQSYHEMGGKENLTTAYDLHPKFADRLSAELNKNGITNIVKVKDGTANISVKIADKERFTEIRKELAQSLKQAKQEREGGKKSLTEQISKAKEQQSEKIAEQPKQPQPHRKPNQAEL